MNLSRPISSTTEPLEFSPLTGIVDPSQPRPFNPVPPSLGSHGLQRNKDCQDSTSPEEYDTDLGDTVLGSSPPSAENVNDENGINFKGRRKRVLKEATMAAIPEYFASKVTKEGKIPKKRGPKPDSKPARDRRQELNRQAQRNHRYRKEEQQKWLEDALADAHDKAHNAMLRAQEAEHNHQNISRIYEQSQCENDRLRQLLDVNGIPFRRVIPQTNPFGMGPPPMTSRQGAFTSTTSTPTIATPTLPSFTFPDIQSSTFASAFNGSNIPSGMSFAPPMDGSDEYDEQGSNPQIRELVNKQSSHQSNLATDATPHASTGQLSGAITSPASAPAATSSTSVNQFGASLLNEVSNLNPDSAYSAPTISSNQADSPTSVNAPTGIQQEDPLAIEDHDQTGVDFILALEENCQDHKTAMNARTFSDPLALGGHSLMLSKVPVEVAKKYREGDIHPHGPPDVGEGPGKAARLLSLVNLKPFVTNEDWALRTGEISPAQALGFIRKDPRYAMLNSKDFSELKKVLKDKCRCYGFGAVVEVYEVEDALNDVFAQKGFAVEDGYGPDNPFWKEVPLSNPHTLDGPEYPSLDKLIEFDLAGLMSNRHAEREQFLTADLQAFNGPSNVDSVSEDSQGSLDPTSVVAHREFASPLALTGDMVSFNT